MLLIFLLFYIFSAITKVLQNKFIENRMSLQRLENIIIN